MANNNPRPGVGTSKISKQVVRTFSVRDILTTIKYKIYHTSQDVYTLDNKFFFHLENFDYNEIKYIYKWPDKRYKKKVDTHIEECLLKKKTVNDILVRKK